MDPESELVFDFPPFLRLYKSGRVERLIDPAPVPAGVDPATGVASKDVVIDPATGLSARLYIRCPSADCAISKRPILVYYHGGAFVIESAFSPTYHTFLNNLVAQADVVAVSVEYRRAPEHPIPAAYDDSFAALKWVASHAAGGTEAWLAERGDFGRIFLAGDSAGGNIAHNILLRTRAETLENEVTIAGLMLIHPYFWGKEAVGSEPTDPMFRQWLETTWGFVCGWSAGIEDERLDPFRDAAALNALPCSRVLVSVTETDWFRERGRAYYEKLKASGWGGEAVLVETEGEEHVYFLSKPHCEKASVEIARFVSFLTRD
ncbi:putative carboxylesterase 7 [Canna indica]|uniref:Carboxylesterase 7 n=1 Tax=Canna indica TaxID=4628 RepID=A0AAQ3KML1_9LILI|nr:putative carboxylesterase 7 [Canna indica]